MNPIISAPLPTPPPIALERAFIQHGAHLRLVAECGLAADLAAKVSASDVVQDTFYAASRDQRAYRGNSSRELRGWLEGILRNRLKFLRRHFRASARRQVTREVPLGSLGGGAPGSTEQVARTTASPLSRVVQAERVEAIRAALERLTEKDRELIRWHHQERLTFEMIGDRLEISSEAARKRWGRALVRLRDAMEADHESR